MRYESCLVAGAIYLTLLSLQLGDLLHQIRSRSRVAYQVQRHTFASLPHSRVKLAIAHLRLPFHWASLDGALLTSLVELPDSANSHEKAKTATSGAP